MKSGKGILMLGGMELRKLIVLEHITLDGVIQGPGSPEEDTSGNFSFGGWISGYSDDILSRELKSQMSSEFDLLLGRKTYDIWAPYWSIHNDIWPEAGIATKYVATRTMVSGSWSPTRIISDNLAREVRVLKKEPGRPLHVWGSSDMVQTLFENDLVDAVWLMIYPMVTGRGKRLFQDKHVDRKFLLRTCKATTKGVIVASYERFETMGTVDT